MFACFTRTDRRDQDAGKDADDRDIVKVQSV